MDIPLADIYRNEACLRQGALSTAKQVEKLHRSSGFVSIGRVDVENERVGSALADSAAASTCGSKVALNTCNLARPAGI